MDQLRALVAHHGFFTRAEARAAGYDDKTIARAARTGLWLRFRRGYYTFGDVWSSLDDVERHRVRSLAVLRSLGKAVALSHVSASVFHGVDIWGIPLDRVHVTRLDGGAGRVEGDVVHHEGFCLDDDVVEMDGHLVMRPELPPLPAPPRAPARGLRTRRHPARHVRLVVARVRPARRVRRRAQVRPVPRAGAEPGRRGLRREAAGGPAPRGHGPAHDPGGLAGLRTSPAAGRAAGPDVAPAG